MRCFGDYHSPRMPWHVNNTPIYCVVLTSEGQSCDSLLYLVPAYYIDHYIRELETSESLKINANGLVFYPISYCDDMYLCQTG